jgi:chromosome segregation ATPase
MVERFDVGEDLDEHTENFADFVEEVNDVSRKEGEVLKFIEKQSGSLPSVIQKLVDHNEKLENFMENSYSAVRAEAQLKEDLEEIRERKQELADLRDEMERSDKEDLIVKKEELEQKIDEVENSQEWIKKNEKEKRIKKLEEEKEEIMSELSRQVSAVERPVKKLLYSVENKDLEFKADQKKLEKMLDRKFHEIEGLEKVLDEAEQKMEENEIADRNKRKKFLKAKTELSDLEQKKYAVDQKDKEIKEIQSELDEMTVTGKKEDLEKEAEELRKKIEEKEAEMEEKKREVDRLSGEIEDLENQVEELLNENLEIEVELA